VQQLLFSEAGCRKSSSVTLTGQRCSVLVSGFFAFVCTLSAHKYKLHLLSEMLLILDNVVVFFMSKIEFCLQFSFTPILILLL
jgi:hypothetical protein